MSGSDGRRGADFDEFVRSCSPSLLRAAVLLAGGRREGEDLLQDVLERVYVAWPRVEQPLPYARQALVRAAQNRWRRRRWRETPLDGHDVPVDDRSDEVAERDLVLAALRQLPSRQRAVIVLRYYEQLSEAEIADSLRCSTGSVKSHASRGVTRLRSLMGTSTDDVTERVEGASDARRA